MTKTLRSQVPRILAGGRTTPVTYRWTGDDAMLYALAVGAGRDPSRELAYTTENSIGIALSALPTFAVILAHTDKGLDLVEGLNRDYAVHGEQELVMHRVLPPGGELTATTRVAGLYDKGNATLLVLCTDAETVDGDPLFTATMTVFFRNAGGWNGPPAPAAPRRLLPDRTPDVAAEFTTRPDQALLYRLTGDRNPLHSDPTFAERVGFDRPILHGLCTYGIAGRVLLEALCDGDAGRMRSLSSRFSSPVLPGESLHIHAWRDDGEAVFRVLGEDGRAVISGGIFEFAAGQPDSVE